MAFIYLEYMYFLSRSSLCQSHQREQAIEEILHEIALYGLWRTGFFEVAAFQSGATQSHSFLGGSEFHFEKARPEFRMGYISGAVDRGVAVIRREIRSPR